jgi:hypothetical protein
MNGEQMRNWKVTVIVLSLHPSGQAEENHVRYKKIHGLGFEQSVPGHKS